MSEINDLIEQVNAFRDDRDWRQFHNPKDLALSLSLEAAELLENFQWKSSEEAIDKHLPAIKEEMADVLIYALMFCSDLDIDVKDIIKQKLDKNNDKYPISKSKGKKDKYIQL